MRYFFLIFLSFAFLSGCKTNDILRSNKEIVSAAQKGFKKNIIPTKIFDIATWSRIEKKNDNLIVYIEGDGLSWISRSQLSKDPTPISPTAFRLAQKDPRSNIIYIARPCQYTIKFNHGRNCEKKYWSSHRFSAEVVSSIDTVIQYWKSKTKSNKIELIGFSGGGAIASLIASNRDDISMLQTIAGNLDHIALNKYHRVTQLKGSLNPIDVAYRLRKVRQIHFIGGNDKIIPPFIVQHFVRGQKCTKCPSIITVNKVTHNKGWEQKWPSLLSDYQ